MRICHDTGAPQFEIKDMIDSCGPDFEVHIDSVNMWLRTFARQQAEGKPHAHWIISGDPVKVYKQPGWMRVLGIKNPDYVMVVDKRDFDLLVQARSWDRALLTAMKDAMGMAKMFMWSVGRDAVDVGRKVAILDALEKGRNPYE